MDKSRRVVVLLSGGQDSTTCLFWAAEVLLAESVLALSVQYGQRHAVELQAAESVLEVFRDTHPDIEVEHQVVQMGKILDGASPLTDHSREVGSYQGVSDLPGGLEDTFVPGRNALFLVLAANRAVAWGARAVVTGTAQEDYGGYPDCRRSFIDAMEAALDEGLNLQPGVDPVKIHTPLMDMSKAETVDLARRMPGAMDALAYSHTCYRGQVPPCGTCHACLLRGKGFRLSGVEDPLVVRLKAEGAMDPSWSYPD